MDRYPIKDQDFQTISNRTRVFFVREGKKRDALPGLRAPFYAVINGKNIGYKQLRSEGWVLIDNNGARFNDYAAVVELSIRIKRQNRAAYKEIVTKRHPNAFKVWTEEENRQLIHLRSDEKMDIPELATALGRTENSIWYQLKKLHGEN